MDEEVRKRVEYEEQFFGMSSKFFSDCFKKFIQDEIESKCNIMVCSLRDKLLSQTKNPDVFESALEKIKEDVTTVFYNAVEKLFPEIESKISEFIHIPDNVLLKEDLPIRDVLGLNFNEIKEEIENLKGTYLSLLYMKKILAEELEEGGSVEFFMKCVSNREKLNFNVLPVEEISELSKANKCLINNDS